LEDIVDYFRRITGFEPIPQQIDMLHNLIDLAIKNELLSAGRGFSKTLCCAVAALWFADVWSTENGRPLTILIVSSQKRLYWHLNNFFGNPEFKAKLAHEGWVYNIPTERCELINGSIIYPLMDTSHSVRSYRADIIFVDEAAEVKTEVIVAVQGCFTGNVNKIVYLSTPHKSGYFTDKCLEVQKDKEKDENKQVMKDWKMLQYSARDAPWQKGMIERMENDKAVTAAQKAMEIEGRVPTKEERNFFSLKQIEEKCTVDREPIREGGEKSVIEFGFDIGSTDGCSLVISEKLGSKRNILFAHTFKFSREEMVLELTRLKNLYRPMIIKMDSMPKDLATFFKSKMPSIKIIDAHLGEEVKDEEGNTVWSTHKEQMLGQLQRKIREGTSMEIPKCFVDLIIQLRRYRKGMFHGDDLVDALALSIYEPVLSLGSDSYGKVYFPKKMFA
jgi:hypothetical protein